MTAYMIALVDVTDPNGELLGFSIQPGPLATFDFPVPNEYSLCGLEVFSQAIHFGGVQPFALSNAQDLRAGT